MLSSEVSYMFFPPTVTARLVGLSLAPLHSGQSIEDMNFLAVSLSGMLSE